MRVIHVLRKPVSESTVTMNVLKHGVGGINIDVSRIASPGEEITTHTQGRGEDGYAANAVYGDYRGGFKTHQTEGQKLGRWPANVILQHLDGCEGLCCAGCPSGTLDSQTTFLGGASRFYKQVGGKSDG